MWSGIPLTYTIMHVLVPVLFIDFTAIDVDVVQEITGYHNYTYVSTCLIY